VVELYGISNCDTMKKARRWLEEQGIEYHFHDYKKEGVNEEQLRAWAARVGWETLLNRRGMMWRKLSPEVRDAMDETHALKVMCDTPSIIKRPVLVQGDQVLVGFSEESYRELLQPS
jgi:Spx/MgsR family transcriptional regulator